MKRQFRRKSSAVDLVNWIADHNIELSKQNRALQAESERMREELRLYRQFFKKIHDELEKKDSDFIRKIETYDLVVRMGLWAIEQGRFGNVHS